MTLPIALNTWKGDTEKYNALLATALSNPGITTVSTAGVYTVLPTDHTILIDPVGLTGENPVITIMLPLASDNIGRIINVTQITDAESGKNVSVTTLDGDVAGNNDFASGLDTGLGGILLAAKTGLWVALGASF